MIRAAEGWMGNSANRKQIVLLVPTFRRPQILAQTLAAMSALDTQGLEWELIVIDNAGEPATEELCRSFQERLPLRYQVCLNPGKSAALNQALRDANGELIVFADDDVLPERGWLQAMWQGACRWPDHVLFGGRVLPHWPGEPPVHPLHPGWDRWTYGVFDPALPEGPQTQALPMGANMAVRGLVFQTGVAFNEKIGPQGSNYAMGNETDLIFQLKRMGHEPVFLAQAVVYHIIRPEQMERAWLIGRAFRQGRGEIRLESQVTWYSVASLAKQTLWKSGTYYAALLRGGRARAFPKRMACSLARGRLYEALRRKLERH